MKTLIYGILRITNVKNNISRIKKDGYKLCTQEVHKIGKRMYSVLRGTLHHHTLVTIFVYNLLTKVYKCFNIS